MKVVAIANYKGGTCKTTTCVNLASALVADGKRVGVIDLDPIADATQGFGLRPAGMPHLPYALVPEDPAPLLDGFVDSEWGVKVLPSGKKMRAGLAMVLQEHPSGSGALRDAIAALPDDTFDYLILDCPGQFSEVLTHAIVAADSVIIPIDVKAPGAVTEMTELARHCLEGGGQLGGILPCRTDSTRLTRDVLTQIEGSAYGQWLCRDDEGTIAIRNTVRVPEARYAGRPILTHAPDSSAALDYTRFARVIGEAQ
jgi:chromosome partitioning protein